MPSLLRTVRRIALALAAALVALVAWTSPAHAAFPGIEISVTPPEGDAQQVLLSEITTFDVVGKYWFPGEPAKVDVAKGNGISLYEVLEATGTADGYRTIQLKGQLKGLGGSFTITSGQVRNPNLPPFFYLDQSGQVHFVQPTSGPSADDPNGYFPIASAAFGMTQAGGEVAVKVKASKTKVEPGDSVTFTATASPSDSYRYDWTIGDASREGAGTKISHRFEKAGRYKVAVGVYLGDDESSLGSGGLVIQVGDPKDSDKDRTGGGDNTAAGAPSTGTTTGADGVGSSYTPSYTPSVTPVPPSAPSTPSAPPPDTTDFPTSGTTVEGNLLADVSESPPSSILESAARAARDGKKRDDSGADGADVSEAALSIAGVLALLALGAGIETRQGRRLGWRVPRPRLPRRGA